MARKQYDQESVNARLAMGHIAVRVWKRTDGELYLQATLPPKPGSSRPTPYQQKIYLRLPVGEEGYRRAEQEARLLGGQLASRTFDWSMWLEPSQIPQTQPSEILVEGFRQFYLETHTLKPATWKNQWQKIYKRLPPEQPLSKEMLFDLVEATDRNTRNRIETCRKL